MAKSITSTGQQQSGQHIKLKDTAALQEQHLWQKWQQQQLLLQTPLRNRM